jgi:hypothetical protein
MSWAEQKVSNLRQQLLVMDETRMLPEQLLKLRKSASGLQRDLPSDTQTTNQNKQNK